MAIVRASADRLAADGSRRSHSDRDDPTSGSKGYDVRADRRIGRVARNGRLGRHRNEGSQGGSLAPPFARTAALVGAATLIGAGLGWLFGADRGGRRSRSASASSWPSRASSSVSSRRERPASAADRRGSDVMLASSLVGTGFGLLVWAGVVGFALSWTAPTSGLVRSPGIAADRLRSRDGGLPGRSIRVLAGREQRPAHALRSPGCRRRRWWTRRSWRASSRSVPASRRGRSAERSRRPGGSAGHSNGSAV